MVLLITVRAPEFTQLSALEWGLRYAKETVNIYDALDRLAKTNPQFVGLKEQYIKKYGYRYIVSSPHNNMLWKRLAEGCRQNNIILGSDNIFKWIEEFPEDSLQPSLF